MYRVLVLTLTLASISSNAQTVTTVRDPQAVLRVRQAVSAMASATPSDSTETGLVQITAGATTSQGAIQILTRGTAQTSVQVQSAGENWTVVYSQGEASKSDQNASTALSLEAASTSESLYFPLPFLSGILQNPDSALQYVGSEAIGGVSTTMHSGGSPAMRFLKPSVPRRALPMTIGTTF